jgi:thiopeptide-type bacteriocin biosynthesis protein
MTAVEVPVDATVLPDGADPAAVAAALDGVARRTDAAWQATHVFYASNANPMITDGIGPLIERLRERGLIERWFFIKYWLEGPHVRLRVLPAAGADPAEVRAEVDAALQAFLRRRPALYEADADGMGDLYKRMFIAEYGEALWQQTYGDDGEMPFRPNNSCVEFPYEREYSRYGGPAGMQLSEWHFEASSDHVLGLLTDTNVHVRPVLLGLSVQLTTATCFAFLGTGERVARFLDDYRTFWETSYQEPSDDYHGNFDKSYARMATELGTRVVATATAALDPTAAGLSPAERHWVAHCRELRTRAVALAEAGALVFQRGPVSDVDGALAILLSSFVHMTNNRLGVSILDEIYVSYVLRRAVLDAVAAGDVG